MMVQKQQPIDKSKTVLDQQYLNGRHVYHFFKRVLDIIFALIGLILLSPLFLIIIVMIKVDDHGPAFYKQKRVGYNGKEFEMFKFRSMVVDADKKLSSILNQNDVQGAMFKMKRDPRITRVGHFLRNHSLDELPQLVNVLTGDMSLVGPRPPLPREVKDYTPYDKQRLWVKPGCTGLWQVTERNDVGFDRMVQLDIEYIQRSGLWYDFSLLVRTIKVVIFPNGAY